MVNSADCPAQAQEMLQDTASQVLATEPAHGWYRLVKAALDLFLALVLFVLTLPLVLFLALLVRLTSTGPAFYRQQRAGLDGQEFTLLKLRTMSHNCEGKTGPLWSTPGDPRVTNLGRFLRKTHLDELPQLWNILHGDISLVGPRPERPEFIPQLAKDIPHYKQRLSVRPGLTGLAQVRLPPDVDVDSVRRKLVHDIYYVHKASLWLDLRILAATALKVVGVPLNLIGRSSLVPGGPTVEVVYQNMEANGSGSWQLRTA
jgi:lipopolysaccharide/colanic/teichoic acid biosynthesis glycosyltransferase